MSSGGFFLLTSACQLASSRHNPHAKSWVLDKTGMLSACSRVEESYFSLKSSAEMRVNLPFTRTVPFLRMRRPTPSQILLRVSAFFLSIFILFIFFFLFFIHYSTTRSLLGQKLFLNPIGRYTHSCVLLVVEARAEREREREKERESFDFATRFIILLWSRHLVAIRRTNLERKRCNLYGYNPNAFAKLINVMNHTRLRDADHGLGIHYFSPTWPCLFIEVLETQVKFLDSRVYCTKINCTFTFRPTKVFLLLPRRRYSRVWTAGKA